VVYVFIITLSTVAISLIQFAMLRVYTAFALRRLLFTSVNGVVAVIILDGTLALFARKLPQKYFSPLSDTFSVSAKERNFYRKIKINLWKDSVPELGCFTGFHKDKIRRPDDAEYIGRFLIESNYGVIGHLLGAIFGFLIAFIPNFLPLFTALAIATVNCVLNILPLMILRFNTPSLRRLYEINLMRQDKEATAIDEKTYIL